MVCIIITSWVGARHLQIFWSQKWKVALFWIIKGHYRKSSLFDNMINSSFALLLVDSRVGLYFGWKLLSSALVQ